MAKTSDGKCVFCNKIFTKVSMAKHLCKCEVKAKKYSVSDASKAEKYYTICVQGYESPEYWLYIDVPVNSTLAAIDGFLRGFWLECCGHMSAFTINGQSFSVSPDASFGDRSMNIKLNSVLEVGDQFMHEYDFGSTTVLKLKVVSEHYGNKRKNKVELLARNVAPFIKCSYCDNQATQVCCECIYNGDGWVCDTCAEKHECGDDMLLPVVNSPRVGVCAYVGNDED